jgi:Domain of unknown function (DUF4386)
LSEAEKAGKSIVRDAGILVDPSWKGVYMVGGACMIAYGLIYIIASLLNFTIAVPPGDTTAFINSLAGHPTLARIVYGLFSLSDFLLLPAVLALYLALKHINKNAMLIAAGLLFLFIAFDLGVTEFNSLTLITLAQHQAMATSDAQRAAYTAAADYGLATMPLASFYSWVVGALGLLIASWVMLKGVFGNPIAYLGIIVNMAAIICSFYFILPSSLIFLTLFLTPILVVWGIWLCVVGFRLYKLSQTSNKPTA